MPETKQKRILLIEDSKILSSVLKEVLEAEGNIVSVATDGITGLTAARREKPDLILLDLLLPKLSGYDVCDAIKKDNNIRHTPILVISTKDDKESVDKIKARGAMQFIKKPYQLDDLLREIQKILQ